MAELGAVVLNNTDLPSTDEYLRSARGNETVVLNTDFKADIATYLSEITGGEGVKTLEDLINFNGIPVFLLPQVCVQD
jgi:amidase